MNKKHATHIITLGLVGPEMQGIQLHNHLKFNSYFYAPNTAKAQTIAINIFEMTTEAENE